MRKTLFLALALWSLTGLSPPAFAHLGEDIDIILEKTKQPDGVVFEVVTSNKKALETVIPQIRKAIHRLRKKWPDMDIAIVAHGQEQFALKKDKSEEFETVQKQVQSLVKNDKADFHVCGTYASWHDTEPEDFVGFINVSVSGPAQINDYLKLGYILVPANPD